MRDVLDTDLYKSFSERSPFHPPFISSLNVNVDWQKDEPFNPLAIYDIAIHSMVLLSSVGWS